MEPCNNSKVPFREAEKARGESYSEFAYKLRANMEEWLKEAKAFGEHDKVVECFGLEQFYRRLPENLRLWVQDRPGVNTVDKAAQLADEFIARRGAQGPKDGQKEFRPRPDKLGPKGRAPYEKSGAKVTESANNETGSENEKSANAEAQRRKKAFEARKQSACYNCGETGHFAASCKKGKLVFHLVDQDEESRQLLEPYVRELAVNGKPCRVLRDSAATMDVVHPSYVEPHQFTGDCAWIKQAVEAQSVCLPIARITIDGPFGELETEAAVSPSLPAQYPYLFSNRSDQLLRERGLVFGEGIVFALTRSKVQIAGVEQQQHPAETDDSLAELFVAPTSESLERLLHVANQPSAKTEGNATRKAEANKGNGTARPYYMDRTSKLELPTGGRAGFIMACACVVFLVAFVVVLLLIIVPISRPADPGTTEQLSPRPTNRHLTMHTLPPHRSATAESDGPNEKHDHLGVHMNESYTLDTGGTHGTKPNESLPIS
ncbi:uncharacterized protein LOC144168428 [Haemaphysalis longicornis]